MPPNSVAVPAASPSIRSHPYRPPASSSNHHPATSTTGSVHSLLRAREARSTTSARSVSIPQLTLPLRISSTAFWNLEVHKSRAIARNEAGGAGGSGSAARRRCAPVNALQVDHVESRFLLTGSADFTVHLYDLEATKCSSLGDQRTAMTFPRCPCRECVKAPVRRSHRRTF